MGKRTIRSVVGIFMALVILASVGCGRKTDKAPEANGTEAESRTETETENQMEKETSTEKATEAEITETEGESITSETEIVTKTEESTEVSSEKPSETQTEAPTEKPTELKTEAPTEKPTEPKKEAPTESKPDDAVKVYDIDKDALPYTEEEIYNQLFDINNKIEFNFDISKEELKKMQNDYDRYDKKHSKSPIYRKADLTITITTSGGTNSYLIRNVGVRMKGNTSRTAFYSDSQGIYSLLHLKVNFQETFDDETYYKGDSDYVNLGFDPVKQSKRNFATLNGIETKWNQTDDATYVREYYAYEMFRDNGILSPRTNIASMDFGGMHMGVYKIYELIDKKFLKRYLPEEDRGGDLYKCAWTNVGASFTKEVSYGVENEDKWEFYNYDLKTNKTTSEHAELKALLEFLNGNGVTKENIADYVDMDYFVTYAAVSFFVGNPDDLRNNYNNYYIYFRKSDNKLLIIPYDNDRCFGITKQYNPSGEGMTNVKPLSQRAVGNNGSEQKNPLFKYTVTRTGFYTDEYLKELDRIAQSKWMTMANFTTVYEAAKANYANDTKPDKTMKNAGGYNFTFDIGLNNGLTSDSGNASFETYINKKLEFYKNNRNS